MASKAEAPAHLASVGWWIKPTREKSSSRSVWHVYIAWRARQLGAADTYRRIYIRTVAHERMLGMRGMVRVYNASVLFLISCFSLFDNHRFLFLIDHLAQGIIYL